MSEYWIPRSVEELECAVANRSVVETAFLDFKAYPERTDGQRRSMAKDLAALSIDGGVLVLGVSEPSAGRFELSPGPLAGWREWISQIGLNACSPAVHATTFTLESAPQVGYIVVLVAPSSRSPHMVDGRYWARQDTTNYALRDDQVRALWQRHLQRRDSATSLVNAEVAREPTPLSKRTGARLFVVAQPVSADPRLLLDSVPDRDLRTWVSALLGHRIWRIGRPYGPSISEAMNTSSRAHGAALSTFHVGPDRVVRDDAALKQLIDLEIREDGGIRHFYGRASDSLNTREVLMLTAVAGEVSSCIELARHIATTAAFVGSWTFGVALLGIKSLAAYDPDHRRYASGAEAPYSEDSYTETSEATHEDLTAASSPVLEQLLGRLFRAAAPRASLSSYDTFPVAME